MAPQNFNRRWRWSSRWSVSWAASSWNPLWWVLHRPWQSWISWRTPKARWSWRFFRTWGNNFGAWWEIHQTHGILTGKYTYSWGFSWEDHQTIGFQWTIHSIHRDFKAKSTRQHGIYDLNMGFYEWIVDMGMSENGGCKDLKIVGPLWVQYI